MNVVKLEGANDITVEVYSGTNNTDILVLSQLDTITKNSTEGLNMELLGFTAEAEAENLLELLRERDPDHIFYYNALLDDSRKIDLNEAAGETLSTEAAWYDYNNAANKFVISEIDSNYLDTGITLAKSSSK